MRKRMKMELVVSEIRFQKLVNTTTFKRATTYHENLSAVPLENKVIEFHKPISIGTFSNYFYYQHSATTLLYFFRICHIGYKQDLDVQLPL